MFIMKHSPLIKFYMRVRKNPYDQMIYLEIYGENCVHYELYYRLSIPLTAHSGVYVTSAVVYESKGQFHIKCEKYSPIYFFDHKNVMIKSTPLMIHILSTPEGSIRSLRLRSSVNDHTYPSIDSTINMFGSPKSFMFKCIESAGCYTIHMPTKLFPKTFLMYGLIHEMCLFEFSTNHVHLMANGSDGYQMETFVHIDHAGDAAVEHKTYQFNIPVSSLKSLVYINPFFNTLSFTVISPHLKITGKRENKEVTWLFINSQISTCSYRFIFFLFGCLFKPFLFLFFCHWSLFYFIFYFFFYFLLFEARDV